MDKNNSGAILRGRVEVEEGIGRINGDEEEKM